MKFDTYLTMFFLMLLLAVSAILGFAIVINGLFNLLGMVIV